MKIKTGSWSPGIEPKEKRDEQTRPDPALVRAGFGAMLFMIIANAAALYGVLAILDWQEVISIPIGWGAALALSAIYVLARIFNNVFFGNHE